MTNDVFFMEGAIPVESLEEAARRDTERAVVTLQGVIRKDKEGEDELDYVIFEADGRRAEDEILSLRREVSERWKGELIFRHRLGVVRIGETSVFMAVSSVRRQDALTACHHVIDRVRHLPGFRKKDVFRDGVPRLSHTPHETILLSDDAFSLPQS